MSRIRMNVNINNESDAVITWVSDKILSGDYTPGWRPPSIINPWENKEFKGEGDIVGGDLVQDILGDLVEVPITGTEGEVRYNIVASNGRGGELYIHWDSPLIESQYGNTFHIWAPPGWEVTHSGGQGHEATLEIRLRRTARRNVPNFKATERGFAFTNHWDANLPAMSIGFIWNKLRESGAMPWEALGIEVVPDDNWGPLTRASAGMCGGMVYAVMDYFYNNLWISKKWPPEENEAPNSPDDVLFQFIRDRLWDSFDVGGRGHRFLGYSSPHYPNGDEGVVQSLGISKGRSWITYREAWPQIQQDIDAGRLSPIGLIQTDQLDIGKNHQVLAYGYQKSGQDVTLYIYDPNEAQEEIEFRFNLTSTSGEVGITRVGGNPGNSHRIYCFFRMDGYVTKMPPNGLRKQPKPPAPKPTVQGNSWIQRITSALSAITVETNKIVFFDIIRSSAERQTQQDEANISFTITPIAKEVARSYRILLRTLKSWDKNDYKIDTIDDSGNPGLQRLDILSGYILGELELLKGNIVSKVRESAGTVMLSALTFDTWLPNSSLSSIGWEEYRNEDWPSLHRNPYYGVNISLDYMVRWEANEITITLKNNAVDRNYVAYAVVEETLSSGTVLHTVQRVPMTGQLTWVPQEFFDQEAAAQTESGRRMGEINDKAKQREPRPGDPISKGRGFGKVRTQIDVRGKQR
jgi:hypothetical protein